MNCVTYLRKLSEKFFLLENFPKNFRTHELRRPGSGASPGLARRAKCEGPSRACAPATLAFTANKSRARPVSCFAYGACGGRSRSVWPAAVHRRCSSRVNLPGRAEECRGGGNPKKSSRRAGIACSQFYLSALPLYCARINRAAALTVAKRSTLRC